MDYLSALALPEHFARTRIEAQKPVAVRRRHIELAVREQARGQVVRPGIFSPELKAMARIAHGPQPLPGPAIDADNCAGVSAIRQYGPSQGQ